MKKNMPLIAPLKDLNYLHQDCELVSKEMDITEAYNVMTRNVPFWLSFAFKIRDFFSKWLGDVQPIGGFDRTIKTLKVGQKADFFDVIKVSKDELVLQSTDKHLSVLVVLQLTEHDDIYNELHICASVITYNFFGKVYMLPVSMAHGFIVRTMLNRLRIK